MVIIRHSLYKNVQRKVLVVKDALPLQVSSDGCI
jgi:hypothetical protein